MRRAVQLLHHSEHAGHWTLEAAARRSGRRSPRGRRRLQGNCDHRSAPRVVWARSRGWFLADTLVRRLGAWPDDVLFRISSLEPMDCTPEIIDVAARRRLAAHFHLPLQHGSDAMLRAMRRPYTARTSRLVERHRDADSATPRSVGPHRRFPGETDADFRDLPHSLEITAATSSARVSRIRSTRDRCVRRSREVNGAVIRARARGIRATRRSNGRHLPGSHRSGATAARSPSTMDASVVTENYLKVRVCEQRDRRNEWVSRYTVHADRPGGTVRSSAAPSAARRIS